MRKNIVFLSEEPIYIYSVDPDEMQHDAAFHLGLQCLQKLPVYWFPEYKKD